MWQCAFWSRISKGERWKCNNGRIIIIEREREREREETVTTLCSGATSHIKNLALREWILPRTWNSVTVSLTDVSHIKSLQLLHSALTQLPTVKFAGFISLLHKTAIMSLSSLQHLAFAVEKQCVKFPVSTHQNLLRRISSMTQFHVLYSSLTLH